MLSALNTSMARKTIKFLLSATLLSFVSTPAFSQIASPNDVANLVFWVDAQDVNGTGIQPVNGAPVVTWVDKSPSGKNLTALSGTVTFQAAGFDGVNPGLRFPLVARMGAANPFAGNFQNEMTVFFVNANNTYTNNFALTLNGTNTGQNIADGRFSFHTPWRSNTNIYFDAGACCGATRLWGPYTNGLTETTLYTGLNDAPGSRQLLRVDGQAFRADATGHNANVSRGIHVGDLPGGHQYDGRFAEIVVYDRGLSLGEIQDVECYLLSKWKPSALPSTCEASISASKSVSPYEASGAGSYTLPGNDVIYTISVEHEGGPDLDAGSVFLVDKLPDEVIFYNGDIDDGGPESDPVAFSDSGSSLTLNYATDIAFSDAMTAPTSMADCDHIPSIGYDPDIRFVCINPTGSFNSGSPNPSFSVSFRTRIK